ncbi:MAG: glycosyltransferase family 39 protein [Candidatus Woesearchaeota archaeon]
MAVKSRMYRPKTYIWLFIIIILGLSLRLYNVDSQSVWTDESISAHTAMCDLKNIISNTSEPTPPLYYIILFFWVKIFGTSAVMLRLLSVIISCVSIYLIYLLASTIYDYRIGLYSALLLALSPIHIFYAQEARAYSLVVMFSILSTYYYIRLLKGKNGVLQYLPYILSSALLIYTHVFAILLLIAHSIHYIFAKKDFWKWVKVQASILLLYTPWLIIVPKVFNNNWGSIKSVIATFGLSNFIYIFYEFMFGRVFPTFAMVMIIIYCYLILRHIFSKGRNYVLLSWMIIPLLVSYILSAVFSSYLLVRYLLMTSIPLIIIIAYSIGKSGKILRNVLLISLVIMSGLCVYMQQNTSTKEPWKEISKYVKDNPVDQIAVVAYYEAFPLTYYYDRSCMYISESHDAVYTCIRDADNIYRMKYLSDIEYLVSDEILLITSRAGTEKDDEKILEEIYSRYNPIESEVFYSYQDNIPIRAYLTRNNVDMQNPVFNKVTVTRMKMKD